MFTVKGIPILVDEVEIIQEIKRQVYEQQGREILRKIKRTGDNIMVCCPVHNHGQERKPSCGISTRDGKFSKAGTVHCFACGYVDTLEGFVEKCFGITEPGFGINWLRDNFISGEEYVRPALDIDVSRDKPKKTGWNLPYVTEQELASYRYYHPYMYERKLTDEIIEKYDVGYQPNFEFVGENGATWKPTDVITFPVRDKDGNCLFVSRRAIEGKTFFLPLNIDKPVYGIYELPKDTKEVVICESVFNALTCVRYGRPAVALFGTGAQNQYDELNKLNVRKFVIGLDPDAAGEKGTWKLKKNLRGRMMTKLVLPPGKDINDLSYEEFINLPEIYI